MAEIQRLTDDLESMLTEIDQELDTLDKVAPSRRPDTMRDIEAKLVRATRDCKMIDMEVIVLPAESKTKWKQKVSMLKRQIKKLQKELQWALSSDVTDSKDGPVTTEMGMIRHGDGLIRDIDQSADTTIKILDETEQLGVKTAATLVAQTDQIRGVSDKLYEISDSLERSKKIAVRMLRRLASDRYMQILIGLIVIAIIVVIILEATGISVSGSGRASKA